MISKENIKKYAPDFLRVSVISLFVGIICGLIGTLFVKIHFISDRFKRK